MARTSLTRDEVERALGELALADRARRLLVTDQGHLVVRWVVRR
jgi:hypothetical protein